MTKSTELKIVKLFVKWGRNQEDAIRMVAENFETALKIRPEGTPRQLAEVIACIA